MWKSNKQRNEQLYFIQNGGMDACYIALGGAINVVTNKPNFLPYLSDKIRQRNIETNSPSERLQQCSTAPRFIFSRAGF